MALVGAVECLQVIDSGLILTGHESSHRPAASQERRPASRQALLLLLLAATPKVVRLCLALVYPERGDVDVDADEAS